VPKILACPKSTLVRLYVKKLTKMHWYAYNNTVPLLNIVKNLEYFIRYTILIFLNLAQLHLLACQPASLPAVRIGSTSVMAPDFHIRKVIVSSLQNCYSEEGLSTAPWSFLSLLLPYKKMRNSQKRC